MNVNELGRSYTSLMRAMVRFPKAPWINIVCHDKVQSKAWAVAELIKVKKSIGTVYITMGGMGMLGPLLFSESKLKMNKVRSFDIDPQCEAIADQLNIEHVITDWKYKAVTKDIFDIDYEQYVYEIPMPGRESSKITEIPDTIINVSCEHIADFSKWWSLIPKGKLVLIQNNNFKHGNEENQLNTVNTLENMFERAPMSRILYDGFRDFARYRSFMVIGIR